MKLTEEDIKRAQTILRRYRSVAGARWNKAELDNVEHLMRVIDALYSN